MNVEYRIGDTVFKDGIIYFTKEEPLIALHVSYCLYKFYELYDNKPIKAFMTHYGIQQWVHWAKDPVNKDKQMLHENGNPQLFEDCPIEKYD